MNEQHPYSRAVQALDDLLALAQAGKVAAFAVLTVDPAGVVKWSWHFGSRPQTDLIGGVACMQAVIIQNAMAGAAPPPEPPIPEPPTATQQ